MNLRKMMALLASVAGIVALGLTLGTGASGARQTARAAVAGICSSANHDPHSSANPLDSRNHTGSNPLSGASLYTDIPWLNGGDAANAIARDIGEGYLTTDVRRIPKPWTQYRAHVIRKLRSLSPTIDREVHLLLKIADQAQAHVISHFSAGGTYDGVFTQAQFYLCRMQATQPGATAVITTYFLDHTGGCTSGEHPSFKPEVDALKRAIGNFSVLVFVEEDAATAACWTSSPVIHRREQLLRYEIDQLSQLPHVLLYVEGGTEDSNTPRQVIRFLTASDAAKTRGFFVNDTHFMWSYTEIRYANQIARSTGLHFVVDTRANGQGPILNPDPVTQGVEELCNPPGRGLGPHPGATDGRPYGMYSRWLDGFAWATTPGNSTAPTCPGRLGHWAASGTFDPGLALAEAARANDGIGPPPRYASRPY
jgi:hypothetical protein